MPIINSVIVEGGPTPSGTKQITTNGIHDVTNYASADVNVPTTAPVHYIEKSVDANGRLIPGTNLVDLTGVTELPDYALAYAYSTAASHISVPAFNNVDIDWSGITTCGFQSLWYTFAYRTGINTFKFGTVGGTLSNCLNCLVATDVKKIEILSSNLGDNSGLATDCSSLVEARFPNVTEMKGLCAGGGMFNNCSSLATLYMPNLEKIVHTTGNSDASPSGSRFLTNNSVITDVLLPKLSLIQGGKTSGDGAGKFMFQNCSALTNLDVRNLTRLVKGSGGSGTTNGVCTSMLLGCTSLVTQKFQSLSSISQGALYYGFYGCTSLQSVWFYALSSIETNALTGMFKECTNVTVHFPMALQASYASDSRFTGGFGGTNTIVLFDLVTSLTGADTNTYTRQEKDSTSTATAWNDGNDTLYYTLGVSDNTNGVNEPSVGDTIYSDAACTTAVTTIDAIA